MLFLNFYYFHTFFFILKKRNTILIVKVKEFQLFVTCNELLNLERHRSIFHMIASYNSRNISLQIFPPFNTFLISSHLIFFHLSMDFPTFLIFQILLHPIAKVEPFDFNYRTVFNFWDSDSDTGGLAAGIAFPIGSPHGQTFFQKPAGRLVTDFLSK